MRRPSSPSTPREKAPFRHLRAIAPYALKRKGKIIAALIALVVAALDIFPDAEFVTDPAPSSSGQRAWGR